jgi:hypothetical protein
MTNTLDKGKLTGKLIPIALALLALGCVAVYAGYWYAFGDVCMARERFSPFAYGAIAASLVAAGLAVWGALRRRGKLTWAIASATALACLALAAYSFVIVYYTFAGFAEFATNVRVSGDGGIRFNFDEGYRVGSLYVEGPAGRWSTWVATGNEAPLIQDLGPITLGQVPPGFVLGDSSLPSFNPPPDGVYRVRALAFCTYRPATTAFVIRQGQLTQQ